MSHQLSLDPQPQWRERALVLAAWGEDVDPIAMLIEVDRARGAPVQIRSEISSTGTGLTHHEPLLEQLVCLRPPEFTRPLNKAA